MKYLEELEYQLFKYVDKETGLEKSTKTKRPDRNEGGSRKEKRLKGPTKVK